MEPQPVRNFILFASLTMFLAVAGRCAFASEITLYDQYRQPLFVFELPEFPLNLTAEDYEGYNTNIRLAGNGLEVDLKNNYFIGLNVDRDEAYVKAHGEEYTENPLSNEYGGFKVGISAGFRF